MADQEYSFVLYERTSNFYEVTSNELPKFQAEVAASFLDEAIIKARYELGAWVARQRERGEELPLGRGRGYVIYGDGMSKTEDDLLWSKSDIRRYCGLSRATIDRRIKDGTLRPLKVGRRVLFRAFHVKSSLTGQTIRLLPETGLKATHIKRL